MPIGNDLVDLRSREAVGKARDVRFIARVFTAREAECIRGSSNRDNMLWLLWAGKEAAYKVAKKLSPGAIFAHSAYEVVLDSSPVAADLADGAANGTGHVVIRGMKRLHDLHLALKWSATASYVHCLAIDDKGDFRALKIAVATRDEIDRSAHAYEPTEREQASLSLPPAEQSLAVRRLARALAAEAGLGDVEIVRHWNGSRFDPPRLYPRHGALPIPDWDITLSHDGDLSAVALGPA